MVKEIARLVYRSTSAHNRGLHDPTVVMLHLLIERDIIPAEIFAMIAEEPAYARDLLRGVLGGIGPDCEKEIVSRSCCLECCDSGTMQRYTGQDH